MADNEIEERAKTIAKTYADAEVKKYNFIDKFMRVSLFRKLLFLFGVFMGIGLIAGYAQSFLGPVLGLAWIIILSYSVVNGGFYDIYYFKKKQEVLAELTKKS
jgi:hypothetical protein